MAPERERIETRSERETKTQKKKRTTLSLAQLVAVKNIKGSSDKGNEKPSCVLTD